MVSSFVARLKAENLAVFPEYGRNGKFAPIVGMGLLAIGLRTARSIESDGSDFLGTVEMYSWAKPGLTNVP